jgi:hypothetical protein
MPERKYSYEETIHKRREVDVLLGQCQEVAGGGEAAGDHRSDVVPLAQGVWGLKVDQAKRLTELEMENTRLKRAVAELTVDRLILKEVAEGKYRTRSAGVQRWHS